MHILAFSSQINNLKPSINFGERIFSKDGITVEQIDKGTLFHPQKRDEFRKEHGHHYEEAHKLPDGNEKSHFVNEEAEEHYLRLLKQVGITPVVPSADLGDKASAEQNQLDTGVHNNSSSHSSSCSVCNGAEHPAGHEACAHHDFGSYTHNIYHWVKSTTEWLLPDSWNLDWLGGHTGSMAAGILDPLTLGITATSALASAGALYFYSKFQPAKQK